MLFGVLVPSTAFTGQVVLDPATGQKTVNGGVIDLGGFHGRAEYVLTGKPHKRYRIFLPSAATISVGGNNMTVQDFTAFPGVSGRFGPSGKVHLYVGGTLEVSPSQPSGRYRGPFEVFAKYD